MINTLRGVSFQICIISLTSLVVGNVPESQSMGRRPGPVRGFFLYTERLSVGYLDDNLAGADYHLPSGPGEVAD